MNDLANQHARGTGAPAAEVAVTGIGMVTCAGADVATTWAAIRGGHDHLAPWRGSLPAALRQIRVAQCPTPPCPDDLKPAFWDRLARTQQLACSAADEALKSAGLPRTLAFLGETIGCFLATTVCGMDHNEEFYAAFRTDPASADSSLMRRIQPCEALDLLRRRHRINGPLYMNLTTCVGSAMALGAAVDAIRLGKISMALAGGTESLCRLIISGFNSLKLVAADGCRPFDQNRRGITPGEGAAFLILESCRHAGQRGARPLGYIRGFAATCDAFHITKPDPAAAQAQRAIELAFADAGLTAREIDYVNAHGTASHDNDLMESLAIREIWARAGAAVSPVSSTKRLTGHTFGAAGAVESAICLLAMERGRLPPNAGCQDPEIAADGKPLLPLVMESVDQPVRTALNCNFAFGGNNTALIFSAHPRVAAQTAFPGRGGQSADRQWLEILAMGVRTSDFENAADVAAAVAADLYAGPATPQQCPQPIDFHWLGGQPSPSAPAETQKLDPVAALACVVIEQARQAAGPALSNVGANRIALLLYTAWGMIESTIAYLDSMLDADGKYASPLHFSRSVYSNAASSAAIRFGIHGSCETLVHPYAPVTAVLDRAGDLLATGRADVVITAWADQTSPLTVELCRRAVHDLGRREFARYLENPGFGAVSFILRNAPDPTPADPAMVRLRRRPQIALAKPDDLPGVTPGAELSQRPYPTDGAVHLAGAVARTFILNNAHGAPAVNAAAERFIFYRAGARSYGERIAIR